MIRRLVCRTFSKNTDMCRQTNASHMVQSRGYRNANKTSLCDIVRRLPNNLQIRQAQITDQAALYRLYKSVAASKTSALGLCAHEITPQLVRELIERQWRGYLLQAPSAKIDDEDTTGMNTQVMLHHTTFNQSRQRVPTTATMVPSTHGLVHVLEQRGNTVNNDGVQLFGFIAASKRDRCVWSHVLADLTIAIDPSYQQKGFGHVMLFSFLHHVRRFRPDIARVELSVFASHQHAIRLYRRHGFICEGVRRLQLVNHTQNGQLEDVEEYAWLNPNFDPTTPSHTALHHPGKIAIRKSLSSSNEPDDTTYPIHYI